jgi:hypothetical protein
MTMYSEDLDSFLDNLEFDESDERTRSRGGRRGQTPLRTPSPQSSFQPRPSANTVTQAQLQAAVRTLDGKITTLAGNVKTLETRTSSVAAEQDRVSAALRKEIEERKKSADGIRRDLQQTKTLAVLLPLISQKTEDVVRADGTVAKVVTQPEFDSAVHAADGRQFRRQRVTGHAGRQLEHPADDGAALAALREQCAEHSAPNFWVQPSEAGEQQEPPGADGTTSGVVPDVMKSEQGGLIRIPIEQLSKLFNPSRARRKKYGFCGMDDLTVLFRQIRN